MSPLLLVLDLDETLLHSRSTPLDRPADLRVGPFHTYFRPGARAFIAAAREQCTLAVWTASTRPYATPIVQALFGDPDALAFFYCVDRCTEHYNTVTSTRQTVKKLARVRRLGFSLKRTLHVDNTPATYSLNYGNGVPIRDFEGDLADRELAGLWTFLQRLTTAEDVRPIEKRAWWHKVA